MRFDLTPESAVSHLRTRGILAASARLRCEALGGGVSAAVVRVDSDQGEWVLKQPHERFRVAQEWNVDTRRAGVEFAFARLAQERLGPLAVAEPVDFDPERCVIVTKALPRTFEPWKTRLLAQRVEPDLGGRAGRLLAQIHRLGPQADFHNIDLFHQQRLEPYLLACAKLHPGIAAVVTELVRGLTASKATLVHGDFSPKNILTDGTRIVLVDHEVATVTDPRFDVAFLLNHLLLKAFRGIDPAGIGETAEEFLYQYGRAQGPARLDETAGILLAALMLARVDGKSPVEYLTAPRRDNVRAFALDALRAPAVAPEELVAAALGHVKA